MTSSQTVAADLVRAITDFADAPAMSDHSRTITYGRLGQFAQSLGDHLDSAQVVGIFGSAGVAMATSAVACVINGRPFVHLDPAMPQMVLHNIVSELQVSLIMTCEAATAGQLPSDCETVDANDLLANAPAPYAQLHPAAVAPTDPIYPVSYTHSEPTRPY